MTIRITWKRVVATLVGLAAAGLLFAWSGIFNVAASSGHWPATTWFIHWVMQNSVRTHAFFDSPKETIDGNGLVSAAGHFASACASCHGAPGVPPSPVMQQAEPPAPTLLKATDKWRDRELFYILRHGIKFTGMPAWAGAGRDDEIRRMVGFLRRLPTMSAAEYRALSGEAMGAGTVGVKGLSSGTLAGCVACHGADGKGRGQPDIPVLGGQHPGYLARALVEYAAGRRASAVMQNAAATLTAGERAALARHFAAMPGLGGAPGTDPRARLIVERGLPRAQLPACASCHGPGKRQPVLAGQKADYIAQRLREWRGEKEVVDARKPQAVMPVIARRIPAEMIDPLARYLAGAPATP
jgi:cytochrome c553